jgi:photosystem II stability/assembly factor-like uncharacterized protein
MFKFSSTLIRHSLAAGLVLFLFGPCAPSLAAQGLPDGKRGGLHKRDDGEQDLLERRLQWFYSTRRAGAGQKMAELRQEAVAFTRRALEAQLRFGPDPRAGDAWTCRGPASSNFGGWKFGKVSGRIIALAADWANGILYAGGASGGLWRSLDDGNSWESLLDSVGTTTVGVVTVDPSDPQVLWVGTGENSMWCEEYFGVGLLRSADGGRTWELRNGTGNATLENLSAFASVVVDLRNPGHVVVGGRYADCVNGNYFWGGLYTTTDAGLTWTRRLSGVGVSEIVQDPVNRDTWWAGAEHGGLYKSTDNGATWTVQTASGLPSGSVGRVEVALSPADPNFIYALFDDVDGSPQFWRSTDGGASWMRVANGGAACDGQCSYNMVIRGHRTEPSTVYRGTVHIFKSVNGGASWTDLSGEWGGNQKVHQDTHDFLMHPTDPNTFYVGCDGGIWKTADGGKTFANLNGNLVMTQFYGIGIHPTDDGILVGGSQDNSSLARTASDTWDLMEVTGDGFISLINPANPNIVYTTSYPWDTPAIYRSSTGVLGPFRVITNARNGFTSGDRINWVTPYTMDPADPSVLYCGTQRVYRSANGGTSWTKVGPPDLTLGGEWDSIAVVEVNPADGKRVWAGTTDGKVWTTADGGDAWADVTTGLPQRSINDIAPDPTDPTRAFTVVGGFGTAHLWEFTGTGWETRGAGLPNVPANSVLMLSGSEVLVGTDVGVFRSTDRGLNFSPYMRGLPLGAVVTDLKYNAATGTLTAGTYGRGVWQITPAESPHTRPMEAP